MTNEELLKRVIYSDDRLFHSNTLSYFQSKKEYEGKFNGTIEFQLVLFSWLSYPNVGILDCPFKVGTFFTNKMQSGKLGVWLCVEESHDNSKEMGEVLAYFVGYRDDSHFYDEKDLDILIGNYKKCGLSCSKDGKLVYKNQL